MLRDLLGPLKDIIDELHWKFVGDTTSVTIILASISDLLPPIAASLSIVWICIRIYETDTVQTLLGKKKKPPEKDDDECA